jgi:hypothetical protein
MTTKKQTKEIPDTKQADLSTNTKDDTELNDSVEEYTPKELAALDKYKAISGYKMDDEEIYDLITKYNYDDVRIRKEIDTFKKLVTQKGEDYGWSNIEGAKTNLLFI